MVIIHAVAIGPFRRWLRLRAERKALLSATDQLSRLPDDVLGDIGISHDEIMCALRSRAIRHCGGRRGRHDDRAHQDRFGLDSETVGRRQWLRLGRDPLWLVHERAIEPYIAVSTSSGARTGPSNGNYTCDPKD